MFESIFSYIGFMCVVICIFRVLYRIREWTSSINKLLRRAYEYDPNLIRSKFEKLEATIKKLDKEILTIIEDISNKDNK